MIFGICDWGGVRIQPGPAVTKSESRYHRREPMKRVDLYIKVEVVLEEEEKPERVAAEICRQLEKLYLVRSAELSNIQTRD
jgi:hypothetical protein